jgi:hypothetical protein
MQWIELVECLSCCCGFSRELRKINITKITHKAKKIIDNTITEYVCLQSKSNHYFLEKPSFCAPPLKIET